MELLNVKSVNEAKKILEENFGSYKLEKEKISVINAAGRYLAEDVKAADPVPAFNRSTKDGYAVRSIDISGAAETLPAFLRLIGEVPMGSTAELNVKAGEAAYVPTGAMIPEGADAIVMIEYTEMLTDDELAVYRPSSVKENIINKGEDMDEGAVVLKTGKFLRPADLGVMTSVGVTEVTVFRKPTVSVISTGDEIVPADSRPAPGMVRDINTYTISAAAERLGFEVESLHVVSDVEEELEKTLRACHERNDLVLLSGGSSVGKKDYSVTAIAALGSPGIQCHGIAFKPGKPTIIANAGGKPVIGLPGHPVSALVVLGIMAGLLIRLMNRSEPKIEGTCACSSDGEHCRSTRSRDLADGKACEGGLRMEGGSDSRRIRPDNASG